MEIYGEFVSVALAHNQVCALNKLEIARLAMHFMHSAEQVAGMGLCVVSPCHPPVPQLTRCLKYVLCVRSEGAMVMGMALFWCGVCLLLCPAEELSRFRQRVVQGTGEACDCLQLSHCNVLDFSCMQPGRVECVEECCRCFLMAVGHESALLADTIASLLDANQELLLKVSAMRACNQLLACAMQGEQIGSADESNLVAVANLR